ncbi:MAG: bifunctional ADP-dependent NAD(P)H-hydrate dehydratase/NAD(P)H-hydrate epimerase, partial [Cyanobium sp. LacPavin_0920_WC12_MAG_62_9]|nr:bifunctional ADP-dependent NAD(P)H-hydrate dehydratase/NAD(P)H-hydrate epimerase [Cyanobium sp. LacPavin_0920_WC12_MAG_62_9]
MAQLEQQLFASGLPVEALMEKAALLVAGHLLEHEPLQAGVLVLVGPGHNGGDALVVARELHLAGVAVRIWSPFERHKPLTAYHLGHGRCLGIPLLHEEPDQDYGYLWIDVLFGIGQHQGTG